MISVTLVRAGLAPGIPVIAGPVLWLPSFTLPSRDIMTQPG
jgi:hypothetical protein